MARACLCFVRGPGDERGLPSGADDAARVLAAPPPLLLGEPRSRAPLVLRARPARPPRLPWPVARTQCAPAAPAARGPVGGGGLRAPRLLSSGTGWPGASAPAWSLVGMQRRARRGTGRPSEPCSAPSPPGAAQAARPDQAPPGPASGCVHGPASSGLAPDTRPCGGASCVVVGQSKGGRGRLKGMAGGPPGFRRGGWPGAGAHQRGLQGWLRGAPLRFLPCSPRPASAEPGGPWRLGGPCLVPPAGLGTQPDLPAVLCERLEQRPPRAGLSASGAAQPLLPHSQGAETGRTLGAVG